MGFDAGDTRSAVPVTVHEQLFMSGALQDDVGIGPTAQVSPITVRRRRARATAHVERVCRRLAWTIRGGATLQGV